MFGSSKPFSDPHRTMLQFETGVTAVDAHRFAKTRRSGAQSTNVICLTTLTHDVDPGDWFQRPHEDGPRITVALRYRVETPMHPIDEVHVRRPGRPEQCVVSPCSFVLESMGRGVMGTDVCFYLDNSTGRGLATDACLEHGSQQVTSDVLGLTRIKCGWVRRTGYERPSVDVSSSGGVSRDRCSALVMR